MSELMQNVDWSQMIEAISETLYMSFISLLFAVIFGLIVGIILFITQKDNLLPNPVVNRTMDATVNIFRAVPFIILMILLFPLTKLLVGKLLGPTAALVPLIIAATPFYARMVVIAFNEVDKGTIEACKAMGASKLEIIFKVLLPEAAPALVSAIALTGISLVGYTAMAGVTGSGGLGNLAYLYGYARKNNAMLYTATIIIVVVVFIIQFLGDYISKKIDKR